MEWFDLPLRLSDGDLKYEKMRRRPTLGEPPTIDRKIQILRRLRHRIGSRGVTVILDATRAKDEAHTDDAMVTNGRVSEQELGSSIVARDCYVGRIHIVRDES